MDRQSRKLAHIKHSLNLVDDLTSSGLQDVILVHNALPEINWSDVELGTYLWGAECPVPFYINALTGGSDYVEYINKELSCLAKEFNIPMAVGSQTAGIENKKVVDSYTIVRKCNPNGMIWANVGAYVTISQALRAVEMIEADSLQIHLNAPQELVMAEGDRDFRGYLNKIEQICSKLTIPVIVKEVGFGISKDVAKRLVDCGVSGIDVGGRGGTNFVSIEHTRHPSCYGEILVNWGIGTVTSLIETQCIVKEMNDTIRVFGSGGVRNGLDIVKLLALGADMVGIAKPILESVVSNQSDTAFELINNYLHQIKVSMLLVGAKSVKELTSIPLIITGETKNWLELRGFDLSLYARRSL